jgi:16S rRNA (uracil1498-N3)-methyltransferase
MQVHFVPGGALHDRSIFLDGAEAKHILKVRRLSRGDEVTFTDGRGRFLHAKIDRCTSTDLHAEIERIEEDPREAGAPRSTLGLSLLKGDHFELAIEKVVELGVHRVQPIEAERCVVRWKAGKGEHKLERWRRIAESAMKQSGRSWLPEILVPCAVSELPARFVGAHLVVADEEEREQTVADLALAHDRPVVGLVGPEGAFSPAEKSQLAAAGAEAVCLSPFRLRSETAAVVLMAALNARPSGRARAGGST